MNEKKILKVKAEAQRFLAAIEQLERHGEYLTIPSGPRSDAGYFSSPKHTGAARRASMDLTRALADLRRRKA